MYALHKSNVLIATNLFTREWYEAKHVNQDLKEWNDIVSVTLGRTDIKISNAAVQSTKESWKGC